MEVCASAEPMGKGVFARKASASHIAGVYAETWQPRFILGPTGDQCHCAAGVSGWFDIVAVAATCGRAGHREQGAVLGLQPLLQVSWQH